MHSIIIQLEQKEPINVKAYEIEEEMWVNTPADYVYDIEKGEELKESLKWFLNTILPHGAIYNEKENSVIFPKGFKTKYFKKSFNKIQKIIKSISLEEFSGAISDKGKLYQLEKTIDNQFDFYIYNSESCIDTVSNFIRYLDEDKKYYIGSIMGYHA